MQGRQARWKPARTTLIYILAAERCSRFATKTIRQKVPEPINIRAERMRYVYKSRYTNRGMKAVAMVWMKIRMLKSASTWRTFEMTCFWAGDWDWLSHGFGSPKTTKSVTNRWEKIRRGIMTIFKVKAVMTTYQLHQNWDVWRDTQWQRPQSWICWHSRTRAQLPDKDSFEQFCC